MRSHHPAPTHRQPRIPPDPRTPPDPIAQQNCREIATNLPNCDQFGLHHPSEFISETISRLGKQQYSVTSKLLLGTPVSELNRAVLRNWMYQECSRLKLSRSAVASANCLVDLFLQKGGQIAIEDFQALGIAALLLVNKLQSCQISVSINERIFPRRLLNALQARICGRLGFMINPGTYVEVLNELMLAWNWLAERHSDLWCYWWSGKAEKKGKVFSSRSIYELLDGIFMVTKSFQFNLFELTLQAFRVILKKDHQIVSSLPKSIEDEVIISFWQNPQDEPLMGSSFNLIFTHFLSLIGCPHAFQFAPGQELQQFVSSFLKGGFECSIVRQVIDGPEGNEQTFNGVTLQCARTFIPVKKNYRKSSGETIAI